MEANHSNLENADQKADAKLRQEIRDQILAAFRNDLRMRLDWQQPDLFSEAVELATQCYDGAGVIDDFVSACRYYVNYTQVFLISRPLDFKETLSRFRSADATTKFMKIMSMNDLVALHIWDSLLSQPEIANTLGELEEWIEHPLRMRAKSKIYDGAHEVSIEEIIPQSLTVSDFLKEHLLSWAFEEGKLNKDDCSLFRAKFPKKYEMLLRIKARSSS